MFENCTWDTAEKKKNGVAQPINDIDSQPKITHTHAPTERKKNKKKVVFELQWHIYACIGFPFIKTININKKKKIIRSHQPTIERRTRFTQKPTRKNPIYLPCYNRYLLRYDGHNRNNFVKLKIKCFEGKPTKLAIFPLSISLFGALQWWTVGTGAMFRTRTCQIALQPNKSV